MASDKLFSDDYLDQLNPKEQVEQGPVTVFGLTFKNDEERRQYFREELRRRLPELRKIEGFPIGEDDDIINLSDPPYYTACPNPWLNDFIAQWEEEKKELQREGKRKANFEVKEPYASDVSEGKNNPIYMAHSYHTKVPHPAIMRYILHYTQPGDIVFDGFAGTGMTGVAANLCGSKKDVDALKEKKAKVGVRHGICSDLSPVATHIAATYTCDYNMKLWKKRALSIIDKAEKKYGWLYKSYVNGQKVDVNYYIWSETFICPHCKSKINLWKESVHNGGNIINSEFFCPSCGIALKKNKLEQNLSTSYDNILNEVIQQSVFEIVRVNYSGDKRGEIDASNFDFDIYSKCLSEVPTSLKITRMPTGSEARRNDNRGILYAHNYYTHRNLLILSYIYEQMKNDTYLLSLLTSTMLNVSKMWKFKPDRKGGSLSGTLYIPSLYIEQNPFNVLRRKVNSFDAIDYGARGNGLISNESATKLALQDNSIDYVFVDPPFGANLMYSQLNIINENTLRVFTNEKTEAIVDIQGQNKNIFEYQQLMNRSFKEFYRILKPGKWLTMEFSNTSASVWNSIQNALQGVGFIVANVAALDKKQGSFKAVTTTTAVKQDLVITCYKPSDKLTDKFFQTGGSKENVWDFIDEHLLHLPVHIEKGNATTSVVERNPKILYDRLISYYVQKGFAIPMDAQEFQRGLHERYAERDGMFFTATQVVEYEEKKLKAPEFVPMGIMVSDEANGIEWLKNELRNKPQTRQDIFTNWTKAIAGVRKGDVIPELDTLLEENFIQNEDGTWRLANVNDDVDLEKLRTKALLKEFKLYLEVCRKPRGKLKDVRVEAVRAGFKQCYSDKNFADIILVGDRIPQNLLTEDEILLQYYDIASSKV
ncbi:DNA methyltransferase [Prevotella sp. P4-119]|uniref:DNA methyltransferase n=1 Tax=Prevotella sp. P4-119 TaxID=2024218 RepID=UPI000B9793B5|nr:DNA methyltransferase [Prevotella sp. P4-119]OYP42473.1 hypothetical protein CIK89_12090 [Prevotella sp. P4-119]